MCRANDENALEIDFVVLDLSTPCMALQLEVHDVKAA